VIEESAVVISRDASMAEVQAVRRGACGGCSARAACGTSLLDRFLGRRPMRLHLINAIDAQVGDQVVIGVPEAALLRAAVAAYLAPLVGLIVGAIGAHELAGAIASMPAEGSSLVGALIGFVLAFRWLQGYSARLASDPRYRAVLLRRDDGRSASVELS
jgi:sigma-E factor negative regulatory protein RseC